MWKAKTFTESPSYTLPCIILEKTVTKPPLTARESVKSNIGLSSFCDKLGNKRKVVWEWWYLDSQPIIPAPGTENTLPNIFDIGMN